MNSVALVGNLATDVDLREVGEGKKVASFLLAVDRRGRDDQADFIRICTWDRQAEVCTEHLSKGRKVGVEGRLRSSSWTDQEGNRRWMVEVTAGRVSFLDRSERAAEGATPFDAEEAAAA